MSGQLHVIGAGIAGLTSAFLAGRQGWRVSVHEASPQAGGRCRTIRRGGRSHDNGTHVLLGANRAALQLLDAVGARDRWIEPEPAGLPIVDLPGSLVQIVGLSPWSWLGRRRRPAGVRVNDLLRLAPRLWRSPQETVASAAGDSPGLTQLLELMSAAVLNTPSAHGSARLLARVFQQLLWPGNARLMVARTGLGPDLVQPLQDAVLRQGQIHFGRRLQGIRQVDGRATALAFVGGNVLELGKEDRVIVAIPPQAASLALPDLEVPTNFEPIVNLHFPHEGRGPVRFIGLTGGLAQWMLVRPGMISITISAAGGVVDEPAANLAARVWPEVDATARRCGIEITGAGAERVSVVKERMATPRQDPAYLLAGPPERQPLANLALAGDWTTRLPATIEAAVQAAHAAVGAVGRHIQSSGTLRTVEREVTA
ncbi:hydroxysqualene dehydroxylase [Geminicoccus roseus]|uniref:hydroxysqualene dehydroxylase n=1 Tax=Geminicoccus roseus TaxID=404900 RepID=UPI000401BC03|nr:FAD-dependent oxidoreductase [Geminicoccus roseus]